MSQIAADINVKPTFIVHPSASMCATIPKRIGPRGRQSHCKIGESQPIIRNFIREREELLKAD